MAPSAFRSILVLLALVAAVASATPVFATTVIPVPETELARGARAIVIGHVQRIESHQDPITGRIVTDVTLTVGEILKGQLPVTELTLRQTGGRVGGVTSWVHGNPEFVVGEKVLVFVSRGRDGTLRVAHLFQGKLSILTDTATGEEHVHREARPAGVNVLGGGADGARITGRLEEMKARIRSHLGLGGAGETGSALPVITDAKAAATTVVEAHESFVYLGSPSRWFEPDTGGVIPMRLNSAGEPAASGSGFGQVRAGYSAWNNVSASNVQFQDAGFTTVSGYSYDGVNTVTFRDPNGEIDPPSGCSGTLAYGGYFRSDETKTIGGQSFYRIIEGDVVFADGWNGCNFYENFNNFAEVATHELGHVLGLGHSTDPDSIMTAYAHLDGRGAQLGADDIAAVRFIYPGPTTPTTATLSVVRGGTGTGTVRSTPTGITCGTDCSQAYTAGTSVALTATPASGSTFAGWSGGGCTGTGTCTVTVNAATSVTATFTKSTTTSGGVTASFSAPAAGATVKNNVSVGMASNLWGTSKTFTLKVDGTVIATKTTTGTTFWFTWNTTTVANGAHTLQLTVTTTSGSATATRTVTVANGTTTSPPPPSPTPTPTPASFTASFSSPAEGATLTGTKSIGMSTTAPWGQSKTWTLKVDGATVATVTNTGTVWWPSLNTTTLSNGSHTLTVSVTHNGTTATATRSINVSN